MRRIAVVAVLLAAVFAHAQERIRDVIYLKQGGCAFTFDVFKPKVSNHKAVVFIVSGGWFSSHNNINPGVAQPLNDRGFTVFEVVHGSQPKFTLPEIVPMVRRAVRFVRTHAADYGIDPGAIGVTGTSAGGHLSLEIGGLGDDGDPAAKDPVEQASSRVQAVVAFMPPTDFLNWGATGATPIHEKNMAIYMPAFGINAQTPEDVAIKTGRAYSPIYLVTTSFPPTLLVHGDADMLVPVQQSKTMDAALESAHVVHKLIIVPHTGHDGATVAAGFSQALDWFDKYLVVNGR